MERSGDRGRLALHAAAVAAGFDRAPAGEGEDKALDRKLHQTIAAVGTNIEALDFNKAVANIYELANAIEKAAPSASRRAAVETMIRLVAPMVPHVAEEAWAAAGRERPDRRRALARGGSGPAGRGRGDDRDPGQRQAARHADMRRRAPRASIWRPWRVANASVQRILERRRPRKVIVVPDRLVNVVA